MAEDVTIDVAGAGAVARGTSKGSPGSAVLRAARLWRWSRGMEAWVLPRSLRPETVDLRVAETTQALVAAGITVDVTGRDDRETDEQRAQRRLERDRQLVDVHAQRAARARTNGDAQWQAGRQIADMIPMGQPILVGHHSEGRHRRDLDRIDRRSRAAVEAWDEAKNRQQRSRSAAARVAGAEARAAGPRFGPADVKRGDLVRTRWGWMVVVRVNRRTVTVPCLVGPKVVGGKIRTDTLEWRKVLDVRTPEVDAIATLIANQTEPKS